MPYFRGQGKVLMASRNAAGEPLAFRDVGNVPTLEIGLESDIEEHKESRTGNGLTDLRLLKGLTSSAKFMMEEFTKENLADAMYGGYSEITAGTVTDEPLADDNVLVGDILRLAKPNASSIVIKDSTGSPLTLVEGTDYEVHSAEHGSIKILNLGAFVQPFTADYSNAVATNVNLLTANLQERWLRFEGLNMADTGQPVLIELYRFSYDPAKVLSLISDDLTGFELEGGALYDDTKENDATLGQFGRIVLL